MKKCIKYLFIIPFLPLFFGDSSFAVDLSSNVVPTGNRWTVGTDVRCTLGDGTVINANQYGECNFDVVAGVQAGGQSVRNIYKSTNIPIVEGNYYSTIVGYANSDLDTYDIIWNMNVDTSNFIISSWREVTKDALYDLGYCSRYEPVYNDWVCDSNYVPWRSTYYEVVLKAVRTADVQFMLGNPTNKSLFIVVGGQLSISAIDEYTPAGDAAQELKEQNDKDDQDRADIQSQQSDSEDGAEDSAEAITNASDSLLAVIGNFVNIVINPPRRDCTISGDMGHMDLGQIDLCQLTPPPAISVIATLLIIGFVIPFAYGIISTVLNLLKGATQ